MSNFSLSQNVNQFTTDPRAEWVYRESNNPNISQETVGSILEQEDIVTINPKHPTSKQKAQIDVEKQFEALQKGMEELRRFSRNNPFLENSVSTSSVIQQKTEIQQDSVYDTKFNNKVEKEEAEAYESLTPEDQRFLKELNSPEKLEKLNKLEEQLKKDIKQANEKDSLMRLDLGFPRQEDF